MKAFDFNLAFPLQQQQGAIETGQSRYAPRLARPIALDLAKHLMLFRNRNMNNFPLPTEGNYSIENWSHLFEHVGALR
jgi:hypothetical protein